MLVCVCVCTDFSPPAGFVPLREKRKTKKQICMFSFQPLKELKRGEKKKVKFPKLLSFFLCSFSHQPTDLTLTYTNTHTGAGAQTRVHTGGEGQVWLIITVSVMLSGKGVKIPHTGECDQCLRHVLH